MAGHRASQSMSQSSRSYALPRDNRLHCATSETSLSSRYDRAREQQQSGSVRKVPLLPLVVHRRVPRYHIIVSIFEAAPFKLSKSWSWWCESDAPHRMPRNAHAWVREGSILIALLDLAACKTLGMTSKQASPQKSIDVASAAHLHQSN